MEVYICIVFGVMILPSVYLVSPDEPRCFSRYEFEERLLERSIKVEHKMEILQEIVEKVLLELRAEKSAMSSDLSSLSTKFNELSTEVKNEQLEKNEELTKLAEALNTRTEARVQEIASHVKEETEKRVNEIDEMMKQQNLQMSRISRDFLNLTNENSSKTKDMQVAFSVSKPNGKLVDGVPIFTQVITNVGGGYNVATGQFTCPRAGLYLFSLSIMSEGSNRVDGYIRLNNTYKIFVRAFSRTYESSAGSVILALESGDIVDVGNSHQWNYVYKSPAATVFNGILITEA